jgi:mycothiol synthase
MHAVELPDGYALRRPRLEESGAIDRLNAACDVALGSGASLTEDLLRSMWALPGFDLDADAWVVERSDALVGFAQVWSDDAGRQHAFVLVHPEHVGRGIGSALAGLVEDRAAERAPGGRLYSAVLTQDEAGARLLAARGYVWARRFWHMEVVLDDDAAEPAPPAGIAIRTLDPDRDLPAAHRVLQEAFRDHWDHEPVPFERFVQDTVDEDFDPKLWFLASDGAEPVGVLYGIAHTDRAWVGELGVLRSHRGRGIATALIRTAFAAFARRGFRRARLNVDADSPTGAVAIYGRVGMREASSYDLWQLPLGS